MLLVTGWADGELLLQGTERHDTTRHDRGLLGIFTRAGPGARANTRVPWLLISATLLPDSSKQTHVPPQKLPNTREFCFPLFHFFPRPTPSLCAPACSQLYSPHSIPSTHRRVHSFTRSTPSLVRTARIRFEISRTGPESPETAHHGKNITSRPQTKLPARQPIHPIPSKDYTAHHLLQNLIATILSLWNDGRDESTIQQRPTTKIRKRSEQGRNRE